MKLYSQSQRARSAVVDPEKPIVLPQKMPKPEEDPEREGEGEEAEPDEAGTA